MTFSDLKNLASKKANLIITNKGTVSDLKSLATVCFNSGVTLTIKGKGTKTISDLKAIAEAGHGCVVLDLSE